MYTVAAAVQQCWASDGCQLRHACDCRHIAAKIVQQLPLAMYVGHLQLLIAAAGLRVHGTLVSGCAVQAAVAHGRWETLGSKPACAAQGPPDQSQQQLLHVVLAAVDCKPWHAALLQHFINVLQGSGSCTPCTAYDMIS